MVDKICDKIMERITAKMPEVDEERAEVIRYGLELMIGEVPKFFILLVLAWILGVLKYTIISLLAISTYRVASGGVHLKTHLGCTLGTTFMYLGNVFISKLIVFPNIMIEIIAIIFVYIFSVVMISLYAPADTENVPILRKKDRKQKKIVSYIIVTILMILSFFIKDSVIKNIFIIGTLIQSITISKFTYKIFKVKFGYLEYIQNKKSAI